jgi:hypothetical protein
VSPSTRCREKGVGSTAAHHVHRCLGLSGSAAIRHPRNSVNSALYLGGATARTVSVVVGAPRFAPNPTLAQP